jgi:hypothetical protein
VPQRTVPGVAALCAAAAVLGLALTGCAKTTIDPSVTTAPAEQTTTTLPTGTAAELLPRLLSEVGKLSDAIGNGDHKTQQMNIVNNLWNAVRPAIAADDGVLVLTFDATIQLCQTGVKLNHPADADKCFRNLTALAASYLARYP